MSVQTLLGRLWQISLIASLYPVSLMAQITLERSYGGTLEGGGKSVQEISDGGYIVTRSTQSFAGESRPARGYWIGKNTAFTVSADSSRVCSFSMSWPGLACGLLSNDTFPCSPIDSNGQFRFPFFLGSPSYEGVFTSATTATGTWSVVTPGCSDNGTWSASSMVGGPFNCSGDGFVEICVWVNNPTPRPGEFVIVYGQLLDGGVGQDGLPMHTVVQFGTTTTNCDRQTGSDGPGLARCAFKIEEQWVGDNVTIDVTITYEGRMYTASISLLVTGIDDSESEEELALPENIQLSQNYPNPFNPETTIRFSLPKSSHVEIIIYNTLGEAIRTLVNAQYDAGHHSVRWDGKDKNGSDVSSGIYFYQVQAGTFTQVKKMSLLR